MITYVQYHIDPETGEPHIYKHDVDEEEVEDVLFHPSEDQPSHRNSRVAMGQTRNGRYLYVVYVRDPEPGSVFVVTAYEMRGNQLCAHKRRRRRRR